MKEKSREGEGKEAEERNVKGNMYEWYTQREERKARNECGKERESEKWRERGREGRSKYGRKE